ncbi:MAG TPA: hypothetical protein VH591_16900 [Ktedonobacterales bacterium]|jgi:modulator of FtsH protease
MEQWQSFFVAQAGASAALTGLLFVAVSINLTHILKLDQESNSRLADRAFGALVALIGILLASSLLLVPTSSTTLPGIGLLIIGGIDVIYQLLNQTRRWRSIDKQYRVRSAIVGGVGVLAAAFIAVAGIAVLLFGIGGVAWLVVSVMLAYVFAVEEAWVLLVEINR